MLAQTTEPKRIFAALIGVVAILAVGVDARAQTPEMQGLPPGQFGTSPGNIIAAIDPAPAVGPAASAAARLPDPTAATPRLGPATRKPAARTPPFTRPNPWMTALMGLAGLAAIVLAAVVLTLAVREMRREAIQRRRFRRRRVARRSVTNPELDARWLPRQRGLFDN